MRPAPGGGPDPVAAVVARLEARGRYGIRLGLGRIRALLRELGSPEAGLPGVLIAGTNGKGSVQAMVGAVLAEAGRRVGQTPKPHLVDYRERILIDGRPLPPSDFAATLGEALAASEAIERRLGPPTEFEVLTAAAFLAFARGGVEVGVVEVGLGGRLDATNAWDGGVAAITNVALDHTAQLGPTLQAIGREKAAIIKRGDLAVTGATDEGLAPIRRRARRLGVQLAEVQPAHVVAMDRAGLIVDLEGHGRVRLGMLGRHQAANAAVAHGIVEAFGRAGIIDVTAGQLRSGLERARWPGRLELLALDREGKAHPADQASPVPGRPDVLLDGAHNPAGMAAFAAAFDELQPVLSPGRPTLLLGAMADKDVAGMLGPLRTTVSLARARIITAPVAAERAISPADLAHAWRRSPGPRSSGQELVVAETFEAALTGAVESARREDGPLLVAGSLYLVGAVRGRLVAAEPD